jgi:hypothetical protein
VSEIDRRHHDGANRVDEAAIFAAGAGEKRQHDQFDDAVIVIGKNRGDDSGGQAENATRVPNDRGPQGGDNELINRKEDNSAYVNSADSDTSRRDPNYIQSDSTADRRDERAFVDQSTRTDSTDSFNTKYVETLSEAVALVRSESPPPENPTSMLGWRELFEGTLRRVKRKTYTVKESDDLETIAGNIFKDKRLAQLIRLLNNDLFDDDTRLSEIKVASGVNLVLPTPDEILQYRLEMLSEKNDEQLAEKLASKFKITLEKRDDRRPVHVCRLWDDLASIARRNSNLQDENLWKLVAVLNKLSTEEDADGKPLVKLKRGQVLTLPSQKDVRDYRRVTFKDEVPKDPELTSALNSVQEGSLTVIGGLPDEQAAVFNTIRTSPVETYEVVTENLVELGASRIYTAEKRFENNSKYQMKLEILHEGKWCSVVEYVIGQEHSELHSFALNGVVKIIRMALPMQSVRELAECDLATNYGEYCHRFAQGRSRI